MVRLGNARTRLYPLEPWLIHPKHQYPGYYRRALVALGDPVIAMVISRTSSRTGRQLRLRLRRTTLSALLSIGLLAGSLPAASPALAATLTFTSTADSYTNSGSPASNYGTQASVRVRSAINTAYLRFNVSGLGAAVQSATLRLFVTDPSPLGGTVHRTTGAWTETGLNHNNAPPLDGAVLATAGNVVAGTWIELDVTPAVTGNGEVNLGIQSTSGNSALYASREAAQDPELVVTTAGGPPPAPVANFSGTPLSGTAPLQVTFTDSSTNNPTSWAWDFQNDGTTDSTLQNPTFTYPAAGTYDVKLTATNGGGPDSEIKLGYVVVTTPPPAPVANFSGTPLSGTAPLQVTFTDSSTNNPTSWAWDFQNDGTTDSTLQNPTFTYPAAGTYDVKLTATNGGGPDSEIKLGYVVVSGSGGGTPLTFTSTADSYTNSGSPASNYGTQASVRVRSAINTAYLRFNVSGLGAAVQSATLRLFVTDPSPLGGTVHRTTGAWTETGLNHNNAPPLDGAVLATAGNVVAGTWIELDVTPAVTGNGEVNLGIQSTSGNSALYASREAAQDPELVVTTAGGPPPAPVANFSGTPLSGTAPLQVTFTDSSTNNPTSWAWDFQNDGTTDSTLQNPTFTYPAAGTYDVKLTATNGGGPDSEIKLGYVVVSGPPAPVASFTGSPTDGTAPLQVTFTDTSTGAPTSWAWDFQNDGIIDSTLQNPIFTYSAPGSYSVRLTASNAGGPSSQLIADFIQVGAPPAAPVAEFSGTPTSGTAPLSVTFTDASTNNPTSWAWDFQNDGVTNSTQQNPTFVYTTAGTYAVRLTAANATGPDSETKTGYIVVGSGGGTPVTFVSSADAHVRSTSVSTNFGTATTLRLRTAPSEVYRGYLRFTVAGLTQAPTNARVRLYVTDASPIGGSIYTVSDSWTETGITWSNAPPISGTALSSAGPVTPGTWIELDVSAAVTGNGTYSFGMQTSSGDSVLFSTREGVNPPQLVVSASGTVPPAPVANFTGTPTSGTAPLQVTFTDTSTNTPTSWAWDFQNDGTTDSTLQNPAFTYTTQGSYSVKLTATSPNGSNTLVRTSYVTVSPPSGPTDVTFVGSGDIAACGNVEGDEATAALLDGIPGTVYTTGDNVYETGTAAEFANCYEPTWGRHKARTRPSVGNHEYGVANASPYYAYFGAAAGDPTKGYYSYDLGENWHIVVLNSNCGDVPGGCGTNSAQAQWLRADLAANTDACTLAYWHHPRFTSSGPSAASMGPMWQALYDDGAEVILNGHAHVYERFAAQTPTALADPATGIRQFTIGVGGKSFAGFASTPAANSEVRHNQTFGVLKFTLQAAGYTWQFVPVAGKTFTDTGSGACHGPPSSAQSTGIVLATSSESNSSDGLPAPAADWKQISSTEVAWLGQAAPVTSSTTPSLICSIDSDVVRAATSRSSVTRYHASTFQGAALTTRWLPRK